MAEQLSEGAEDPGLGAGDRWVRSQAFSEFGWHRIAGRGNGLWFAVCGRSIKEDDAELHTGERDPEGTMWFSPKEGVVHAECWWADATGRHR